MPRDLPPIASLRAFAFAARSLSFKTAAAELGLSPSALSRQIQALEDHLGVRLFRRLNPGLALTAGGTPLPRRRRRAHSVSSRRRRTWLAPRARPLRVSALESFSESWLVPHLPDFERLHPDVPLEIEATLRYADFARDAVDVAIRFGRGPWDGLHSEPLVDLDVFPVCSPTLAAGPPPLRDPQDLAAHTLIHVAQTPDAWREWLRATGAGGLEPRRAVTYDHVSIALSAAESGQGIALSTGILCERRLREGRLCRPFTAAVRSTLTYHFVCRPEDLGDARVTALRDWLVERLADADAPDATADAK